MGVLAAPVLGLVIAAGAPPSLDLGPPPAETPPAAGDPAPVRLDAAVCRRLALEHCPPARQLQMELRIVEARLSGRPSCWRRPLELQQALLHRRIVERRNDAAADALIAFYQLAQLDEQLRWADQGLAELARLEGRLARLRSEGLTQEPTAADMAARRAEAERRRAELQTRRRQADRLLQQQLGFPWPAETVVVPEADFQLRRGPIDRTGAAAQAAAADPQLQTIRLIRRELNADTLPLARAVLSAADGALGATASQAGWLVSLLSGGKRQAELEVRRRQLALLEQQTQQAVLQRVAHAADDLERAREQAAWSARRRDAWRRRLQQLARRGQTGESIAIEESWARLELYQAESQLAADLAAARIAEVRLEQAQCLLAVEPLAAPPPEAAETARLRL